MSRYWEIPQLKYDKVIEDLKSGKIPEVKLEFCDAEGNVVDEWEGRPRVFDGGNYVWLYRGIVFEDCLGVKVFGPNEPWRFFEILKRHYGIITPVYEEDLGILHIG